MDDLTLEEHGAYSLLSDLIVLSGNRLRHDIRHLSGHLRVDPRVCKRLLNRLIDVAGFYVDPNQGHALLKCRECDETVDAAIARLEAAREAGTRSGIVRRYKSAGNKNKNNGLSGTPVPTGVVTAARSGAAAIDRSLQYSPKKNIGETCHTDSEVSKFLAALKRPSKQWLWEGVVSEPPNVFAFPRPSQFTTALAQHSQDFDAANIHPVLRTAA